MKTTRKLLSILLVLAMVSALFVVGATAEGEGEGAVTPVQVTLIDESGNLEGSKIAPDGKPETATDLVYLSDVTNVGVTASAGVKNDVNYHSTAFPYVAPNISSRKQVSKTTAYAKLNADGTAATDADGNAITQTGIRDLFINGQVVSVKYDGIYLGGYATYYENGISTHPNALGSADRSIIYATNGAEYFYSIVGGCGSNITDPKDVNLTAWVDFEVYGSTAETYTEEAEFVLLASATKIGDWYTAEFNVDVSEYNYIKLLVRMNEDNVIKASSGIVSNSSCGVTWADACLYNLPDYTVTYDGNGGKTEDDKESVTVELTDVTGAVVAAENTFAYVEAEGSTVTHIFNGWNTVKEGGETTAVAADADITKLADAEGKITLYAQWKEVTKAHTVTFVVDGETHSTVLVEDGADATLPTIEVEEGYTLTWDGDGKNITSDTTITGTITINTYTVTFVIPDQENTTATVEHGADVTLPTIPEKAGYVAGWDHDGKAITADTTITASYKRDIKTQEIKLKKDPSGIGKGVSNKTYLSDLHDASEDGKNLGLNKYVIDQGNNSKIILNNSYSQPAYYFIEGGRKVGNGTGVDADGYRTFTLSDGSTIKIHKNQVVLGYTGTLYEKALGVHPNTKTGADRYIVYDISSLDVNAFYAVAGATGNKLTIIDTTNADYNEGRGVTFEVWGSMDETYNKDTTEFVKLAYVDEISGYNVGEFKVNLEGINFLKLVVKLSPDATTNDSSAVAWGGAMVYKAEASADTADGFSMTAVAAAIVAATSVVALVVTRKKFF